MAGPAYGNAKHELVHGPAIADSASVSTITAPVAGANPTAAEFAVLVTAVNALRTAHNALVTDYNLLLAAARSANLIA